MKPFDRVGWACSYVAPAAFGLAAVALLASVVRPESKNDLFLLAAAGAAVGVVAHALLGLHVATADFLTSDERRILSRALHLTGAYGRWRATMRGELPQ
jgi:hypothetical protein